MFYSLLGRLVWHVARRRMRAARPRRRDALLAGVGLLAAAVLVVRALVRASR